MLVSVQKPLTQIDCPCNIMYESHLDLALQEKLRQRYYIEIYMIVTVAVWGAGAAGWFGFSKTVHGVQTPTCREA